MLRMHAGEPPSSLAAEGIVATRCRNPTNFILVEGKLGLRARVRLAVPLLTSRMRVLYVNHTGQVSGGEKSLLEVLRRAAPAISPIVACPEGPLADAVAQIGVERVAIPGMDCSLKLHPRDTAKALSDAIRSGVSVRAATRRHNVSLVHANTIRAGLIATLAAVRRGPPTVVHVRDRLPSSRISTLTLRALGRADLLIANSRYTAASLEEAGVTCTRWIIGNPVDLSRFDPDKVERSAARAAFELEDSDYVTSVLAQITPWKGQEEAIRAVARVHERHPNVKLLLLGSAKFVSKATRYDNRAYLERLHRLVAELGVRDRVKFAGECKDVPAALRATDALLVPSWEEPFGRSMIEAMAMEVPVLATSIGGPSEVITPYRDGLLLPPRQPEAWSTAIQTLIESPLLHAKLAHNGRMRAVAFGVEAHVAELLHAYRHVSAGRGNRSTSEPDLAPVQETSTAFISVPRTLEATPAVPTAHVA